LQVFGVPKSGEYRTAARAAVQLDFDLKKKLIFYIIYYFNIFSRKKSSAN